jgi:hypothetical protein
MKLICTTVADRLWWHNWCRATLQDAQLPAWLDVRAAYCQCCSSLPSNRNLLSCHHIMQPLSRRDCAAAWCSGQPFGFQCSSSLMCDLQFTVVQPVVMVQDLAPHRLIIRGLHM